MPAGLGTLFVGLLLIVLAFVEGDSGWKSAHQILFGLFGCGSFVLGAAVCYLAILYTRGQDLLMQLFKLLLVLVFASIFSQRYSLNHIKSKTVGDGQHGTARGATPKEIQQTYKHVPFRVDEWRRGENRPQAQGLVLGCVGRAPVRAKKHFRHGGF